MAVGKRFIVKCGRCERSFVLSWRNARLIRGLVVGVGGIRSVSFVTRCGRCGFDGVVVSAEAGRVLCRRFVSEKVKVEAV